ncbi:PREDICTED: early nodulin-75-like isoform X2 [Nicrophorus vespilloides]|uniref:ATP synthase F(0) complex subunit e, mitochondrial n=1 Tax=Nicrophorus vespilloides TaxID=110193 RepID=A0ABM1NCL4_NICVS|nr:PREDICTED: early nodulin-75-like isoform X2 [Nicrophorus vespilloides]
MAALPPPLNVNPVIKLARWTLLLWGIHRGSKRQRKLAKKEVKIREAYLKKKKIRDEQMAIQKSISSARDIALLAALAEPPIDYMRYYSPPGSTAPKAAPPPEHHPQHEVIHEVVPKPVEAPPTKEDSHDEHAAQHSDEHVDEEDAHDFEVIEENIREDEQEHEHAPVHEHGDEHKKPPCKPKNKED